MFAWAVLVWYPWYDTGEVQAWSVWWGIPLMIVVDLLFGVYPVDQPKVKTERRYTKR